MEHIWNRFGDASYIHEGKKTISESVIYCEKRTKWLMTQPQLIPDAVVTRTSKRRLVSLAKASKKLHKGFRAVLDKIMKRLRQRIRVKGLDRLRRQFRCRCFAVPRLPAPPRSRSRSRRSTDTTSWPSNLSNLGRR